MTVSLILFIFWLFSVFQRWTHYSFSSWKWVWKLFWGLKLWIHDSPAKCKTTIFVFHPPPTQHQRLWVILALILTNYPQSSISGMVVRPVWLNNRGYNGMVRLCAKTPSTLLISFLEGCFGMELFAILMLAHHLVGWKGKVLVQLLYTL